MITNGLNATEERLAKELKEAAPGFRLKMAVNLCKNKPENLAIIAAANVPGLMEDVQAALRQDAGKLTPQHAVSHIDLGDASLS